MKPIFISGKVTKGFQRGSKLLGYPTAENFEKELEGLSTGVYFGWASVRSNVYKTVLSIGYNPHFNNQKKTIEPYLIHEFDSDFYDEELRLCITGYIRGEKKFNSLDELIEAIGNDVKIGSAKLDEKEYLQYKTHKFFQ